jgi:hypothetical protein
MVGVQRTIEILLVAGFAHPPNVDAANWMAGAIMKSIFEQVPDAALALVGADPSKAVRGLAGTRIEVACARKS